LVCSSEFERAYFAPSNGVFQSPLFLALKQRVYDVSAGAAMYGPGRSYHLFTGKDATRAYGTGCLRVECLIASVEGLSDFELKEVRHSHPLDPL
jgi:predicted heme/steroid binding protein